MKIIIYKQPDGSFSHARFETRIESDIPEVNGQRAKHYVYKDDKSRAYIHEVVFLTREEGTPPPPSEFRFVSEHRYWGKVRLVGQRDILLPETWIAIASAVEVLEKHSLPNECM